MNLSLKKSIASKKSVYSTSDIIFLYSFIRYAEMKYYSYKTARVKPGNLGKIFFYEIEFQILGERVFRKFHHVERVER